MAAAQMPAAQMPAAQNEAYLQDAPVSLIHSTAPLVHNVPGVRTLRAPLPCVSETRKRRMR